MCKFAILVHRDRRKYATKMLSTQIIKLWNGDVVRHSNLVHHGVHAQVETVGWGFLSDVHSKLVREVRLGLKCVHQSHLLLSPKRRFLRKVHCQGCSGVLVVVIVDQREALRQNVDTVISTATAATRTGVRRIVAAGAVKNTRWGILVFVIHLAQARKTKAGFCRGRGLGRKNV